MCRCTVSEAGGLLYTPSWRVSDSRTTLKIRAFHLRLAVSPASARAPLPETLTLVYLSRSPGTPLEINGSKARPGAPALLSLHRVRSAEHGAGDTAFASTDRVWTGDGAKFEVYAGEHRAMAGAFREGGKGEGEGWRMECRFAGEMDRGMFGLEGVEVRVVREGGVVMREEVEMPVQMLKKRTGRRRLSGGRRFCSRLAGIPEEEVGADGSGCRCSCCGEGEGEEEEEWEMVGSSEEEEEEDGVMVEGLEVDGVRWAVDAGIWVMCLGVGLLVSTAPSASRRRRRGFLF